MSHVALVGLRSRWVNLLATPETSSLRSPWFRTLTTCHIRPRSSIAEQQYARARLPRYAPSTSRKQAFGGSGTCTSFSTSSRLSARHNRKLPSLVPKDRGVKELQQTRTLTWRDYDPEGGLPLPSGDLPRATIVEIFGDGVNRAAGNWIIRLMNYRRESGSLIEHGLDFPVDNGISRDMAYKALVYLRQTNPDFNESEAGASWADEQVEQLEGDFVDRASGSRLYEQEEPQEESVLVRLRKLNDAKWKEADRKDAERQAEEEQQALAQARADGQDSAEQQSGPQGLSSSSAPESPRSVALHKPLQKAWLQPVERKPWVKYYEQQAQIVKDNIVPEMSTIRRLGPSALVVLAVLGSCYYLHENYVPPPRQARLLPDVPPAVATIGAIIALNLAIAIGYRMPPLWRFFNRYFVCAPGYPVPSSIFLSMFAHQKMTHLFFNSVLFFTFGQFCKSASIHRKAFTDKHCSTRGRG